MRSSRHSRPQARYAQGATRNRPWGFRNADSAPRNRRNGLKPPVLQSGPGPSRKVYLSTPLRERGVTAVTVSERGPGKSGSPIPRRPLGSDASSYGGATVPPLGGRHAAEPIPNSRASRASENIIRTPYGSRRLHTDRMNDPVGELPTSQRTSLRASPVAFRPSPLPRVGHRGVTAWTPPAQPQFSGLPSIVLGPNHRPNQLSDKGGGGPKNQRYSDLGTPVAIC